MTEHWGDDFPPTPRPSWRARIVGHLAILLMLALLYLFVGFLGGLVQVRP